MKTNEETNSRDSSLRSSLNRRVTGRTNLYLLLPIAYLCVTVAYYWASGRLLQFLPIVYFAALVPVIVKIGPWRNAVKYWVPLVMIILTYEALAGVVGTFVTLKSVTSMLAPDERLWGFNLTGWVQRTFYSSSITDISTLLYALHLPLTAVVATLTWRLRRPAFGKYVTTMVMTSYSALFTFLIFPTAPPWYSGAASNLIGGAGFASASSTLAYLTSAIESDKFAAFPSLHAAYAMVFAYFMFKIDRRLGFLALPITLGILFSTLYLGQHYLIDLIGGAFYGIVPCLISERYRLFDVK